MSDIIPVVLFAYARAHHLQRTLEALRQNHVPLIYAFSDGPKGQDDRKAVTEVRSILRAIDWCDLRLCERETNLGLGRSIMAGVGSVLREQDKIIVFEDDLICVPGTYAYLCAALQHYEDDPRVTSVTGWTHPLVTPSDVGDRFYFDGRAECWVWGTWARAWKGMEKSAKELMEVCKRDGIDVYGYGADLPAMAEVELEQNIWAVRFLYLHILNGGLCLRPPWSMVEHIGFDALATNAADGSSWANPPLKPCPQIPERWPEPIENPGCVRIWQKACGRRPSWHERAHRLMRRGTSGVMRRVAALFK